MEQLLVFGVRAAPDATLAHVDTELRRRGFTTAPGAVYDLIGRKGLDRVFIGVAPHARGLAARIKCKALWPGRTARLFDEVLRLVTSRLGSPLEGTATFGEVER